MHGAAKTRQVYAGPMSESVPSSVTGFAHRTSRADSVTSFTYFQEDNESPDWAEEEAILEHSDDEFETSNSSDRDLESAVVSPQRRKSSKTSAEDPLLHRVSLTRTNSSTYGSRGRRSQKIYIETEDMTVVVAGFSTSAFGFAFYIIFCVATVGLGYLLFRWIPRWKVQLMGTARPLRSCDWVVMEVSSTAASKGSRTATKASQNQWGEFTIHDVDVFQYGHSVSSVFGTFEKAALQNYDDDDDPVMAHLHFLDYRYIRFCFHPTKDKFLPCSNWKDPNWTDLKSVKSGLDSEEWHRRNQIFGSNQIEIKQKSIPQLLVDEVCDHVQGWRNSNRD